MTKTITLGSRPSKLALWQSEHILAQLKAAWPETSFRIITMVTEGDRVLERPLPEIGGKGVFTQELEYALLSGEIDLAVHSLKDLPVEPSAGLIIGAISSRADARDVFISASGQNLEALAQGSRVGTSSLRRQAQIKAQRPDLNVLPLRGNVDTRLRKALQGEYDGIILAAAGLERLGLGQHVTEYLPYSVMLPAPGQGALAVQCRAGDEELARLLRPIHDESAYRAVTAERAFLAGLGGGCSAPVAAYATVSSGRPESSRIEIEGLVATPDGQRTIRVRAAGDDPQMLGQRLAQMALEQGAGEVLR